MKFKLNKENYQKVIKEMNKFFNHKIVYIRLHYLDKKKCIIVNDIFRSRIIKINNPFKKIIYKRILKITPYFWEIYKHPYQDKDSVKSFSMPPSQNEIDSNFISVTCGIYSAFTLCKDDEITINPFFCKITTYDRYTKQIYYIFKWGRKLSQKEIDKITEQREKDEHDFDNEFYNSYDDDDDYYNSYDNDYSNDYYLL